MDDLRLHTHLLCVAGSRAYGLHTDASDVDLKGFAIPPIEDQLGIQLRFQQADSPSEMAIFAQDLTAEEQRVAQQTKLEGSVYRLRKFAKLALDCNPHVLDVLFCREAEVRICTPIGRALRDHRSGFLSRRALHSFSGYAAQQLKRIQTHRRWLLDPPTHAPTRAEYALPEQTILPKEQLAAAQAAVKKQLDSWELDLSGLPKSTIVDVLGRVSRTLAEIELASGDRWTAAARTVGLDDNLIDVMARERAYGRARSEWRQYSRWLDQRNPQRAALEAQHGYDTKHAAHLIRLMRMCTELLASGEVTVWRGDRDADELQAIRAGVLSYEALMEQTETLQNQSRALARAESCPLPARPNHEQIEALVIAQIRSALGL